MTDAILLKNGVYGAEFLLNFTGYNNPIMENNQPQGQQIDIELNEEVAEGIYSNLAIITHSNSEFILDFIRIMPGVPKGKVKSRIILTPQHAKRLLGALSENISRFEAAFGDIDAGDEVNNPPFPMNFGGPTGMA